MTKEEAIQHIYETVDGEVTNIINTIEKYYCKEKKKKTSKFKKFTDDELKTVWESLDMYYLKLKQIR